MRTSSSATLSFLLAALAACGTVSDEPIADAPDGTDFSLVVTPTELSVPIGGSGDATLTIDRVGGGGDVELAAQGLPAGVTATFAANPVAAGTNSTTVTFAVAGGTAPATATVTLVGTSGGVERTTTLMVTATPITVTGVVKGEREGVTVRIVGKPAVTSGAGGTFTFTDVVPPYDLYTVGQSGLISSPTPTAHYFHGLTRTDPVVTAPSTFGLTILTNGDASVTGTKSGGDGVNQMRIAWEHGGAITTAPSSYAFTAFWTPLTASNQGRLFGFQYSTRATGAPDVFTGFGASAATTLNDNGNAVINLAFTAPSTASLTGTVTSPVGFPTPSLTLNQQLGPTGSTALWTANTTLADATIPLVTAGKAALSATATLGGATTKYVHPALDANTDVTFVLPAPAVQIAPVASASGITTATEFSWTDEPDTVHEVQVSTSSPQPASFLIYTTEGATTIPALPELALPTNQNFTWRVNGYSPTATMDDACTATGLEPVSAADYEGPRHAVTSSTARSFTSAP
ncbi:MAG: hypothetical protein R2939_04570 [Kofleriaceae bacterium]